MADAHLLLDQSIEIPNGQINNIRDTVIGSVFYFVIFDGANSLAFHNFIFSVFDCCLINSLLITIWCVQFRCIHIYRTILSKNKQKNTTHKSQKCVAAFVCNTLLC